MISKYSIAQIAKIRLIWSLCKQANDAACLDAGTFLQIDLSLGHRKVGRYIIEA
jgi:hypothetical protein